MTDHETETLWLGAFRYYLGRRTYAVSEFCDLLVAQWETLPERCRTLIRAELEKAIARDNDARAMCAGYFPLGMDVDRDQWLRVRELWKERKP